MQIVVKVLVAILTCRQLSESGHAPDRCLVPVPVWPLEGFIVKTGRPQSMREIEHAPEIKVDVGETVLAIYFLSVSQGAEC